jgi:hypothetical protein
LNGEPRLENSGEGRAGKRGLLVRGREKAGKLMIRGEKENFGFCGRLVNGFEEGRSKDSEVCVN